MWTRVELKDKAKQALKNNYWKIILVTLLVGVLGGGATAGITNNYDSLLESESEYETNDEFTDDYDIYEDEEDFEFSSGDMEGLSTSQIASVFIIIGIIFFIIIGFAIVVGMVYSAFLYNPLGVGMNRFFVQSLNEKAEVKEIAFAFDHNYKNVIKILFIRDVKLILWSLLFIIPGIIKGYEYYMMPYLLAENPNLTKEETFRLSKEMMRGNKFNTFILELSFFWWDALSALTAGIVGIFYVQPYKNLTYAALYEELSAKNGYPARVAPAEVLPEYTEEEQHEL